ncbi:hypothetical protein BGZ57DRAFT_779368 [Hyaloscypha finlandica]|nr:hypothetical protein BGZ57DRAFT_779368 [Hyaloscypha finlandica]
MHALGIKPGDGLVEWRPSLDGYIRTQNDEIEMEIAGSAFFTVVNLFTIDGMMDEADVERVKRPEEIRSVRLEFGRLAWAEQGNEIHARFQPGTETEINSTKLPFHRVRSNMEPGTFITSYLNALQNGITHSDLVLPDHTATLETRVKTFSNALRVIKDGRSLKDPILVTYGWLQSATRIIKRLLANGGEDQSFYEDVCRTCEATIPPQVKQRPGALDDMKDRIRKEFLFGEDVPSFYVEKPKRNGVTPPSNQMYQIVLEGYKDEPAESWKHDLFLIQDEILELVGWEGKIWIDRRHRLLPFSEESSLWNQRILLG